MPYNATGDLTQSFNYDFSKKNAGTRANHLTGVQLPANALVYSFSVFCYTSLVATAGAKLAFGTVTNNTFLSGPFMAFNLFTANSFAFIGVGQGLMDKSLNIVITINPGIITAGTIKGFIKYFYP